MTRYITITRRSWEGGLVTEELNWDKVSQVVDKRDSVSVLFEDGAQVFYNYVECLVVDPPEMMGGLTEADLVAIAKKAAETHPDARVKAVKEYRTELGRRGVSNGDNSLKAAVDHVRPFFPGWVS